MLEHKAMKKKCQKACFNVWLVRKERKANGKTHYEQNLVRLHKGTYGVQSRNNFGDKKN